MIRLPATFKQEIPSKDIFERIKFFRDRRVNTVCTAAQCPNLTSCFKSGCVTFMILGDACSRSCRFCAVKKRTGEALVLDGGEPERIAEIVQELKLGYVVITSVTRDDLSDGGAGQFSRTVKLLRQAKPDIKIEALVPDFSADFAALRCVIEANPDVIGHNLETVKRLYPEVRPKANYHLSLAILKYIKDNGDGIVSKSSLMLGMGERKDEIIQAIEDLREVDCQILTLGQYLSPSANHYPVRDFISDAEFNYYRDFALNLGFRAVLAGPLVRSSYRAQEVYKNLKENVLI